MHEVVSEGMSNEVSHKGPNGKVERETVAQVRCQKAFLSFLRKERPLFRTRVTDRIGLQQVRLSWKHKRGKELGGTQSIRDEVTIVQQTALIQSRPELL